MTTHHGIASHRIAADLRNLFGPEAGTRRALADIASDLYKSSPFINRIDARERAFALMWDYEAKGFVVNSPGSRGGAGWALSMNGAALIEECMRG
ncbi:hypothetical protein ACI6PO_28085 (plasmid) [Agrobacterium tumefaciens]